MEKTKVSIIIPCYGVEKYLDRCLNSVVNQTLKDIEIILVDDVSPDRVPEMCDQWASKDERIKVIHKLQNEGLGLARNTGLEIATGEYVAFLDSDDFVDVSMYEKLYNKAKEGAYELVFCNYNTFYSEDKIVPHFDVSEERSFVGRSQVDSFLFDLIGPAPEYPHDVKYTMSVWHGIYLSSIIRENNLTFVSERDLVSEDLIFDIELLPHVNSVGYLPEHLHYYVVNPNSLSHSFDYNKYKRLLFFIEQVGVYLSKYYNLSNYELHYWRYKFLMLRNFVFDAINTSFISPNEIVDEKVFRDLLLSYPWRRFDVKRKILFGLIKNKCFGFIKVLTKIF